MIIVPEMFLSRIFVYDSLRAKEDHNFILKKLGGKFIKDFTIIGFHRAYVGNCKYSLWIKQSLDPAAVIIGEIWEVPTDALSKIDAFKGVHKGFADRKELEVGDNKEKFYTWISSFPKF